MTSALTEHDRLVEAAGPRAAATVARRRRTLRGAPEKTEDTGWSWDALETTVNDLARRYA